jgi:hypothetical protein
MRDLIIKAGIVIDGTGSPGRKADVALDGDRAYLDQLARNAATAALARSVAGELARAERGTGSARRAAATRLSTRLERNAPTSGDERRVRAAAEVLRRIGASRD